MPFIEEEKFSLMQQDFENAKLRREEAEHELNEAKHELNEFQDNFSDYKRKSKIISTILGILLGVSSGLAFYLSQNKSADKVDVAKIRAEENRRILDSIIELELSKDGDDDGDAISDSDSNTTTFKEDISNVNKKYKDKKIYSVQIGAFTKRRLSLRSKDLLTGNISTNGLYKYSIGIFSSLNEARMFRRELIKLGFRDAFVASYINGKREAIERP